MPKARDVDVAHHAQFVLGDNIDEPINMRDVPVPPVGADVELDGRFSTVEHVFISYHAAREGSRRRDGVAGPPPGIGVRPFTSISPRVVHSSGCSRNSSMAAMRRIAADDASGSSR